MRRLVLILAILLVPYGVVFADNFSKVDVKNPLYYYPDFIGKTVEVDNNIISLDAPKRAADPAFVPLKITTSHMQKDLFIEKIWVFVDNNPMPLVAVFEFGEASERADLAFNIRVNEHSFVRAIALTKSGQLYQANRFVKASGGCSAPVGTDITEGRKRLGQMRLGIEKNNPSLVNLKIRHINLTGMQMDQVTRIRTLPHYVKSIKASLDGKTVFLAKTGFSVSEDPNFRFYVSSGKARNQLKIEVLDTESLKFVNDFSM